MHPRWQELLSDQRGLFAQIELKLGNQDFLPPREQIMKAFEADPQSVKVVIVGQDPYPTPGVAIGLAFAIRRGTRPIPGSLRNIFKELGEDIGQSANVDESLETWLRQGVLLLNRHLTCASGQAGSHHNLGWAELTDAALRALDKLHGSKLVVVLWGNQAQQLESRLGKAQVIRGVHPSPLSAHRGFFGSKPFSNINRLLSEQGLPPIDWLGEKDAFGF